MSNPPAVSSTCLSIASPPQPLSPHEARGDKAPQQQKAAPPTPSTWRRKQAVLVLVFVLVPLLMSDGSAKNNNEKHSNKPGLSLSRVEGRGDTTAPSPPTSAYRSPLSALGGASGAATQIRNQRTQESTPFVLFPFRCNCRYEEQPDARRHTFKEALSKFMYGRNDTASSSSPTTSVQQRRVLVVGDSVGRYLAAGIVNGVIEEGALDRDVLESLNLAAEQTKMKGGVATNLRKTRGTIAQWPPPEMLAKMSPAVVDKLPFRLQFEMDIFVSQDRNFTATRNMFDPTHIILARGNWDLDRMTPSNPRRYYNEFQGLLAAVRRAFPETHMFVYGFHKLNPGTSFLKKHPHIRCTHNKEIAIFREANYCAVKRYNGLLLYPGHRAVHYIDSFGITKGFRKSNQENKDGMHYIGAALAALAHSTVEMMLAAEQQVVGNRTSVSSMNATEVQQCTIAVKDEFHTSRMPCQTPPSWLNETVQTAFELSQEVIFAGKHMHRIAATISCGGTDETRSNATGSPDIRQSLLFPPHCAGFATVKDINAVKTKRILSPAIKALSLAASSCSKLLVWLKEEFSGVQNLQRFVADAKRGGNPGSLPWTLTMLSVRERLHRWLSSNMGRVVNVPPASHSSSSTYASVDNFRELNLSVIDVAAQCVTMFHTHVTPAFFHEVLWPLSYGSGMVPCGAVRFLPFFQEWLSMPFDSHSIDSRSIARHTARLPPFTEIDQHCHPGSSNWHNKAFGGAREVALMMLQEEQQLTRSGERQSSRREATVSMYLRHCPRLLNAVEESLSSNLTHAGLLPSDGADSREGRAIDSHFFNFHEALDQFPVSPLIEDLEKEVLGASVKRCLSELLKLANEGRHCEAMKKLQGVSNAVLLSLVNITQTEVHAMLQKVQCTSH